MNLFTPSKHTASDHNHSKALTDLGAAWRALPLPPTPDIWPYIEPRLSRRRNQQRVRPWLITGAAAAILLLLMARPPAPTELQASPAAGEIEQLTRISELLENEWRAQRRHRGIVSGAQIRHVEDLTALIGMVDEQLMPPPDDAERARRLWRQRVLLMNELLATETAPTMMVQIVRSESL